jgi:membrane-bound lytic murein transglycosylase D
VYRVLARTAFWLLVFAFNIGGSASADDVFPRPAELEPDIHFWTRVYTEIDTHQGFIHDARNLAVIYETIDVPPDARSRNARITRRQQHYRAILLKLAGGARQNLDDEEQRVLDLWPDATAKELRAAADELRFQLGQSDRFREGYVRAGAWLPHIQRIFTDAGLPPELGYLPHVESSFNPYAYSHAAAAGLWQFTNYTGRRFMRVDYVVDERMDPFLATAAAARLLKENYDYLGSWPLALTAYNHGVGGMQRAVRNLGTTDIATILRLYQSKSFGFASRNFYVSFLAAVDVERNAEQYFGPITRDSEELYQTVTVESYMSASALASQLGVDRDMLRDSNPALRAPIWRGEKYIPRGYQLRVPADSADEAATALASIAPSERYSSQLPDTEHRVVRGETLSGIAAQYGVSVNAIVQANGLRNAHQLHIGQVLHLPTGSIGTSSESRPAVASTAAPARAPAPAAVDGRYVVRRGDSLSKIAARLGVDATALADSNGIKDPRLLKVGQVLELPTAPGTTDSAPAIVASTSGEAVSGTPSTYVVQSGDTLAVIAKRFATTEAELASRNGLTDRNRIYIGQAISVAAPPAARGDLALAQPANVAGAPAVPAADTTTGTTSTSVPALSPVGAQPLRPAPGP